MFGFWLSLSRVLKLLLSNSECCSDLDGLLRIASSRTSLVLLNLGLPTNMVMDIWHQMTRWKLMPRHWRGAECGGWVVELPWFACDLKGKIKKYYVVLSGSPVRSRVASREPDKAR